MNNALGYFDFVSQFLTVLDPVLKKPVPMKLYPMQRSFAQRVLETRDLDTGLRVIRRALYAAPKKTGKTAYVASLASWHFFFEPEIGKEIVVFAWDLDQTEHMFNAIVGFIERHPMLRRWATIGKREIAFKDSLGRHTIRRIARDELGSHGGNPSMVISDETWTLPDWSMVAALSFSPVRPQPLFLFTSYAGYESDMHPGRPLYDLWLKLQPGAEPDPSFHGVWLTGDDARREVPWWSESWIREQARLLKSEPGAFRRLVENEWAQSAQGLFTQQEVRNIVDPSMRPTLADPRGPRRTAFLDLGWSRDHTALVTVHRDEHNAVFVDDVFHLVGTRDAPIEYAAVEHHILDLHRRFSLRVVADQWGARQLIQRLKAWGITIRETTVSGSYHDRIARNLIELVRGARLRAFPHDGLEKQLGAVVLKRSQAASRDDSSVKVKIDSGAGAGVAGKDDLVVALSGAAFEVTQGSDVSIAVIRVQKGPAPSNAMQELRAQKTEQLRRELERAGIPYY